MRMTNRFISEFYSHKSHEALCSRLIPVQSRCIVESYASIENSTAHFVRGNYLFARLLIQQDDFLVCDSIGDTDRSALLASELMVAAYVVRGTVS